MFKKAIASVLLLSQLVCLVHGMFTVFEYVEGESTDMGSTYSVIVAFEDNRKGVLVDHSLGGSGVKYTGVEPDGERITLTSNGGGFILNTPSSSNTYLSLSLSGEDGDNTVWTSWKYGCFVKDRTWDDCYQSIFADCIQASRSNYDFCHPLATNAANNY